MVHSHVYLHVYLKLSWFSNVYKSPRAPTVYEWETFKTSSFPGREKKETLTTDPARAWRDSFLETLTLYQLCVTYNSVCKLRQGCMLCRCKLGQSSTIVCLNLEQYAGGADNITIESFLQAFNEVQKFCARGLLMWSHTAENTCEHISHTRYSGNLLAQT